MKKILALALAFVFILSTAAFAAIAENQVTLGGLTPGVSVDVLISKYGQPRSKHGDEWRYRDFTVEVDQKRNAHYIEEISTTERGFLTAQGIGVGNTVQDLTNAFGRPSEIESKHGKDEYTYYSRTGRLKMEFKIAHGIIQKISYSMRD